MHSMFNFAAIFKTIVSVGRILEKKGRIRKMKVILYILVPNPDNLDKVKRLYPYEWARPIHFPQQKRNLLLMENAAWDFLKDKIDTSADFVGTLSSRARTKMSMKKLDTLLHNSDLLHYDYVNFQASSCVARDEADLRHENFKKVWDELCEQVGDCNINLRSCYCNYWMCKPSLFLGFSKWASRVFSILETMPLAIQKSNYETFHLLTSKQLIDLWGKPYYPLHVFILERFNLQYFRNYKCLLLPQANFIPPAYTHLEVIAICIGLLILLLQIKYKFLKWL